METIVGIYGLDVECKEFSFAMRNDEGKGGIGTEDIPEDIAEEGEYGGESVKGENEEKDADHTISSTCTRSFLVATGKVFHSFSCLLVPSGVFFLAPPGSRACNGGTILLVCLVSNLLP